MSKPFHFKKFVIHQDQCAMKVGTDGVLLGAWADIESAKNILDIGTGTGVIALMAAQRNENAHIDAVEIDKASAKQAGENFAYSTFNERLNSHFSSVQAYVSQCTKKYDAIISNPPYFEIGNTIDVSDKRRQRGRQTTSLTFEELIESVILLLDNGGSFHVVFPVIEGKQFIKLALKKQFYCVRLTEVKSVAYKPIERLLLEFSKVNTGLIKSSLTIQKSNIRHDYTTSYIQLAKSFYTIL